MPSKRSKQNNDTYLKSKFGNDLTFLLPTAYNFLAVNSNLEWHISEVLPDMRIKIHNIWCYALYRNKNAIHKIKSVCNIVQIRNVFDANKFFTIKFVVQTLKLNKCSLIIINILRGLLQVIIWAKYCLTYYYVMRMVLLECLYD